MLKESFIELVNEYGIDAETSEELWEEIETHYSGPKRYYHSLVHLLDLFVQLNKIKSKIKNWNVMLFTLFYHDIIYDASRKDNEEQSAKIAAARLKRIGVKESDIELCYNQILATQSHLHSKDADTNYFTDADLSILGREPQIYQEYVKNVRNEYSIYPTFIYNRGRKKVLNHFLTMDRIFKTDVFHNQYETQAKMNLKEELKTL